MGFRFQRRIRLAPGVYLNASKSGLGISVGPPGAKVGIGPRGVHSSFGWPGTGMSIRQQHGRSVTGLQASPAGNSSGRGSLDVTVRVQDDGTVDLLDAAGVPLTPRLAKLARQQQGQRIDAFLEQVAAERWNKGIEEIIQLHLTTPDPMGRLRFTKQKPAEPRPPEFQPRVPGFLARLIPALRRKWERNNERERHRAEALRARWDLAQRDLERAEAIRERQFRAAQSGDPSAMEELLSKRLEGLPWPRETAVSFQVREDGRTLVLDVDLPEVEDMPTHQATRAARGLRLIVREKSAAQVRREYMAHVHAVLFRLVGEAFMALPTVQEVLAAGYSQRADRATGHTQDDYLVSARVPRAVWEQVNFQNLDALDLVSTFERFDLRRKMTKTGIFSAIQPHATAET